MALSLSTNRDADTVTVSVSGDVDLSTVAELERAIVVAVDGDAPYVVVDLTEVTFIDSAGINTLLKSRRLADGHGRRFRVVNATGVIRDVLDMTGVWGHLSG
jgi:anti-sigma B factor antagonist